MGHAGRFILPTLLVPLVLVVASAAGAPQEGGAKDRRTPAQRKIDSQLLQEIERRLPRASSTGRDATRGETTPVAGIRVDRKQRALVDIRVEVTPAFKRTVTRLGATIVSTSVEYRSIVAWVPLSKLELLAADEAVRAINPAPEPAIHR